MAKASGNERNVKLQMVANVATLLVAMCAIGLSIWEGRENRLHNRLSVLPQLERIQSTLREGIEDTTYSIKYALDNSGLGPAVLKDVIIFYKDSLIFRSGPENRYYEFHELTEELEDLPFFVSTLTHARRSGELLRAGSDHLLFHLDIPIGDTIKGMSRSSYVRTEIIYNYSFVFCYCSVYGEDCQETYLAGPPPEERACSF